MAENPFMSVGSSDSGYTDIYGKRRGRGRFGSWKPKETKPANYSTDLKNVQEVIGGMMPGGWGQMNPPLGISYGMASGLAAEENKRQKDAMDIVRQQLLESQKMGAGMSQKEIDMRLGQASDAASESMMQNAGAARSLLGASGIVGGGQAAAVEGALRLNRMGQIQTAKSALVNEEAARRMQSANDMFARAVQGGSFLSQGPSMLELDQLNSIIDVGLNAFLGEKQAQAAKSAAKDNKKASALGAVTSVLPF